MSFYWLVVFIHLSSSSAYCGCCAQPFWMLLLEGRRGSRTKKRHQRTHQHTVVVYMHTNINVHFTKYTKYATPLRRLRKTGRALKAVVSAAFGRSF